MIILEAREEAKVDSFQIWILLIFLFLVKGVIDLLVEDIKLGPDIVALGDDGADG